MKVGGIDVPAVGLPGQSPRAPVSGTEFGAALKEAVADLEKVQGEADRAVTKFASGEDVDLHTVMLSVQKAELSFRLMLEVRNKLIEAYREVMRMQV